jgi:hypothetical protein
LNSEQKSDAGESPKRKDTTFRTWRKIEIKKFTFFFLIAVTGVTGGYGVMKGVQKAGESVTQGGA